MFLSKFSDNVRLYHSKPAIVDMAGSRKTTYAELDELSSRIAAAVLARNPPVGMIIPIILPRSREFIAAELGVLKAGCAYAPLSDMYPMERITYIQKDCGAAFVIDRDFYERAITGPPADHFPKIVSTDNAFVIYTSGSTGNPKGVIHGHNSLFACIQRHGALLQFTADDTWLISATFSFVIVTMETFLTLYKGATLHILPEQAMRDIRRIEDYIRENDITIAFISPRLLKLFKNSGKRIRIVLTGSEKVADVVGDGYEILNIYGSSETATGTTGFTIDRKYDNTPIGKPMDGITIDILDETGKPVKEGEEGEICITGILAKGYLNLPEETAKKFNHLGDGKVIYHSGDIGKLLPDGNYLYLNRKDWMVKINGQRVETGEIETLMNSMPEIGSAVVKGFENSYGQTYLCAFYTENTPIEPESIKAALARKLPAYMIPQFVIRLSHIPLNQNGKVDRKSLLPPEVSAYKTTYAKPETDAERILCEGFERILKCGKVGKDDNFFSIGGDSIKAVMLTETCAELGVTAANVFSGRTPKGIAALLGIAHESLYEKHPEPRDYYPLTYSQTGILLECLQQPESTMYNIPICYLLPKNSGIDLIRFCQAVQTVLDAHPAIHVRIGYINGAPVMIKENDNNVTVPVKPAAEEEIEKIKASFVRPFDLENDQLFRAEIFATERAWYFCADFHHIIFDGTSTAVFCEELKTVYNGGNLKPEELSLFDIAVSEQTIQEKRTYLDAKAYFAKELEGLEIDSNLIADFNANKIAGRNPGARIIYSLSDELSVSAIGPFLKKNHLTENAFFLGAFAYALAKATGQQDVFFCSADNGRHDSRFRHTIGMLVRTLPLRIHIEESQRVVPYLAAVQSSFYETMGHDCCSFSELAEKFGINSDIMFVYQSDLMNGFSLGNVNIEAESLPTDIHANLILMVFCSGDHYELSFQYRADLYQAGTIRQLADIMIGILEGILSRGTLAEIPLLTGNNAETLAAFNRTENPYDKTKTAVRLFREQAEKTPDNTAVVYHDIQLTYCEVDRISERIGKYVKNLGIGRDDIVSILVPRCEYMPVASLGVLKAGAAYQPLDPTYPKERLVFMIQDAGAKLLIADEKLLFLVPEYHGPILLTKDIPALPDEDFVLEDPKPEDLFILLYTSGSTGIPKGCMIEHGNLMAFCHWHQRYYELTQTDRIGAFASFGFDSNIMDTYPTFNCGAAVHIIDDEVRLDLIALGRYFDDNHITHSLISTQVGRQFAASIENHSLHHLSVGGETLVPVIPPAGYHFTNVYGPAECTVISTAFFIDKFYDPVPIGKPLDNMKLYVIDAEQRQLPVGMPGELCLAGPQISRGYLNRPEQTGKAYTNNPFSKDPAYSRMYHSGDIVRWLPEGNMEFIGRRDTQVKIRGFRIELTEIEGVILEFPGIKDTTVAAFDETGGGKFIAAYVVSDSPVEIDALETFILERKPPYMVPAVTMQIDAIPLNQNQKVNKRALPKPMKKTEQIVLPENETQQKIFNCIAEVIGNHNFGITTDIYRAGLSSIGAMKLNVLLSNTFNIVIKIRDLKENSTIRNLEHFIGGAAAAVSCALQDSYPLTETQNGIFVECVANPGSTIYNIPFLFRLGESVDLSRIKTSLEAVVAAHPYIKTTMFLNEKGDLRQKQNNLEPFSAVIGEGFNKDSLVRPFNILGERLFRIELYDTPEGKYLFTDFHHLIFDGISLEIFLEDLNAAYEGVILGSETYSGFEAALEEKMMRASDMYPQAKVYFEALLANRDTDFLIPRDKTGVTPVVGLFRFTSALRGDKLKTFCSDIGITPNAYFIAAFGCTLAKYSYKDEAVFTTIYNGRTDSRLAHSLSMLVKTLPVYCQLDGEREIRDLLTATRDQLMNSMANDIYSFADISHAFGIKADILVAYQGETSKNRLIAGAPVEQIDLTLDTAKAPISVDISIENGRVGYFAEYRAEMYEEATIAGFIESFDTVVQEFLEKQQLKEVSALSEKAFAEVMGFNKTDYLVENVTANVLFERSAAANPEKTAVISCGRSLTFAELNANANRVANSLLSRGINSEQLVAVMLPRTVDIYAARQGILKAGGAFLPIDPDYPDDRISYILEDSHAPFIIMTRELAAERNGLFKACLTEPLAIEDMLVSSNTENPTVSIKPEDLAYCIYTSGSTGKPKGVMIEHRNLVNYVDGNTFNTEANIYITHAKVSLALAAITFDVSILEECIPLYHGITVCLANEDEIHNPLALGKLILENCVNAMTCTPSFLLNIIDADEVRNALRQIDFFNIGAEAFPIALYDKIQKLGTNALVLNGYGPTETTIGCTFETVTGGRVTIGKPLGNMKIVMIDKYHHILPAGVPGELLILGSGVGRGYVGKPELTAEKFIAMLGLPAYRSGDLARWNHAGKIEFMGRMDNQVKLRGLRVELDEIESVMNEHPGISTSVVVVRENESGQFLCGYFTASTRIDKAALIAYLLKYFPPYMVPGVLMQLQNFPMTKNGKVDKRALPEPEFSGAERQYTVPVTELQKELCGIFALAVGLVTVGINDDFFGIGGTSLSASKVAMKCMTKKIPVAYADIFNHSTVEKLEAFILSKTTSTKFVDYSEALSSDQTISGIENSLERNCGKYIEEVTTEPLGDVLLTGATGFLGIHVLEELIRGYHNKIFCFIRRDKSGNLDEKLKAMLMYYFGETHEDLFGTRLFMIEGDITDETAVENLGGFDFSTVINCAASVKHFAADDSLDRINVYGVENLIRLCKKTRRKLIHISTVSVAGENINGKFPPDRKLHENELFFGQSISNKYIDSKFRAEKAVLEAVAEGLRGKVIRVGNLMSRDSDGEFQINFVTNGFMRGLRGYAVIGKFPVSAMDTPVEFSPIDSTSRAILKLAETGDNFTVFHAYNNHLVQMADVIAAFNEYGIRIDVVRDNEFLAAMGEAMEDERKNMLIAGLISYLPSDKENSNILIDADNSFTLKVLYRLGFKWPITSDRYLKNAIAALETLNFFDETGDMDR